MEKQQMNRDCHAIRGCQEVDTPKAGTGNLLSPKPLWFIANHLPSTWSVNLTPLRNPTWKPSRLRHRAKGTTWVINTALCFCRELSYIFHSEWVTGWAGEGYGWRFLFYGKKYAILEFVFYFKAGNKFVMDCNSKIASHEVDQSVWHL